MRARTIAAAVIVVGLALLIGALGLVGLLRWSLVRNIDSAARARAADVAALARDRTLPRALAVPGDDAALVQVVDRRNRVLAASSNIEGQPPIGPFRPERAGPSVRTLRHIPIGSEGPFRVVARPSSSPSGSVTVFVATSLDPVDESVAAVARMLGIGVPLLLVVVGVTAWLVVGRALRPVEAIRAEVADISARALDRRVPEPAVDDEVGRLARTMNDMLDRLQVASDRQRRFVSDASHELRSPLTSARAGLEVALAHPDGTDWQTTAAGLLAEHERMERLVQDLLFLARADEDGESRPRQSVDLDDLVIAEVDRLRRNGGIEIDTSGVSAAEVQGRTEDLARLVRNLLENAHRYARSRITVEVRSDDGETELVVSDDGPGIPSADRERIFERFTRLDDARSRADGGAGLGLAIAREIVAAHGGRIWVQHGGAGARFVVNVPASAS